LPEWVRNDMALLAGLICGLLYSHFSNKAKSKYNIATKLSSLATTFLHKFFVPLVPIFVLGFVLKLQHDGNLANIIKNYALIFLAVFITQLVYVLFLFAIGSRFRFRSWVTKVKNSIPPFLTGFGTMSSAATMPVTLIAAQRNTNDSPVSKIVIPATVNIHLIGDCIAVPILALAILSSFGLESPTLSQYLVFTLFFGAAKFAIAAVPAGGIIVMLPILQQYLNFNSEMLSLILAMYVMFDAIGTAMNVSGNSAFVIVFNNIYSKLFRRK